MRFTVVDNGREVDMYKAPITISSPALQAPFYLLLNMAVGGNFTHAATPAQVTAPLPATTYVDYVRVYELDGKGESNSASVPSPRSASSVSSPTTRRSTTSRRRACRRTSSCGTTAP